MAELAAAARRESRRRKILENSQSRLKLITGDQNGSITETTDLCPNVQNDDSKDDSKNNELSVEELLQTVKQSLGNQLNEGLLNSILSESASLSPDGLLNPENVNFSSLGPLVTEEQTSNLPNSSMKSFDYSKIYVMFLALIIRLLFIFQMQFCVRDSITLPFIIYQLTSQFFNRNSESVSAFSTLLLLSNLPPNRVRLIVGILRCVEQFATAFCLYFFTFMVVHVILDFVM